MAADYLRPEESLEAEVTAQPVSQENTTLSNTVAGAVEQVLENAQSLNLEHLYGTVENPQLVQDIDRCEAGLQKVYEQFLQLEEQQQEGTLDLSALVASMEHYEEAAKLYLDTYIMTALVLHQDTNNRKAQDIQKDIFARLSSLDAAKISPVMEKVLRSCTGEELTEFHRLSAHRYQYVVDTLLANVQPTEEEIKALRELQSKKEQVVKDIETPYGNIMKLKGGNTLESQEERKRFFEEFMVHREALAPLGEIMDQIYRIKAAQAKAGGFPNGLAMAAERGESTEQAIIEMLEQVDRNRDIYQKYMEWKREALGVAQIGVYDESALLAQGTPISGQEGLKMIVDALQFYSPEEVAAMKQHIDEGRLQYAPLPHKLPGSISYHSSDRAYGIVEFHGDMKSVFTMAHELGHIQEKQLAAKHNTLFAERHEVHQEIFSTFNELLLFDGQLRLPLSPEKRTEVIAGFLETQMMNLFRIPLRTRLEQRIQEDLAEGTPVTFDRISDHWMKLYRELNGSAVDTPEATRYSWTVIPHFFNAPYYSMAYTRSALISFGLYHLYQQNPEQFIASYQRFREEGGSASLPVLLERHFGLVEGSELVQGGFETLRKLMDTYLK